MHEYKKSTVRLWKTHVKFLAVTSENGRVCGVEAILLLHNVDNVSFEFLTKMALII